MESVSLEQVALLLAAAAIAAPLAKVLRVGTVLGYLLAGALLGPYGFGQAFPSYTAQQILHVAEFGVVLLLFLIGLELRPRRLMSMRNAIVGLGGAQVALTALVLALLAWLAGMAAGAALLVALALSLSSTAFALQVLDENGELTARHGRLAFAVLLFQDLAAIPLIALVPLFAVGGANSIAHMDLASAVRAVLTILAVAVIGNFVLGRLLALIARTKVNEAMTAAALLTVVAITLVMQRAGLPASLGAFIAGALLAESAYRHQLEADIKPFEGLLLGVFFTAIGMSLNLELLGERPSQIAALVAILVTIKTLVLYALGRRQGLDSWASRRLGLSLSQGGEFAFVVLTAGAAAGVLSQWDAELFAVVVTLSMAVTPLVLLAEDAVVAVPLVSAQFVAPPAAEHHVIIAGFGRVGQICARILRAKRIPFTALDINPEQIALVERFGSKAFYGDATRPEVLEAAGAGRASAFVLAIDDIEASLRAAENVRRSYPELPIYARARNRTHVHRLMDLGVKIIRRETYLSSLDLTRELLRGLGFSERDVRFAVDTFNRHDQRRLIDDYKDYTDMEKMLERARTDAETLAALFDEDAAEQAKAEDVNAQRERAAQPKRKETAP